MWKIDLLFIYLLIYAQVPPHEPEADRTVQPPDLPTVEPGPEKRDITDPETEAPQNPSREFLKFTNQAVELKVSCKTSSILLYTKSETVICIGF